MGWLVWKEWVRSRGLGDDEAVVVVADVDTGLVVLVAHIRDDQHDEGGQRDEQQQRQPGQPAQPVAPFARDTDGGSRTVHGGSPRIEDPAGLSGPGGGRGWRTSPPRPSNSSVRAP